MLGSIARLRSLLADVAELSEPSQPFAGCTEAEVAELESLVRRTLPPSYVLFLRAAGRSAGRLFRGSSATYPELISNVDWLRKRLASPDREDAFERFPEDAFPFLVHQGYTMLYFCTNLGDASPVFQYIEYTSNDEIAQSFVDFVADQVAEMRVVDQRLGRNRKD